MGPEGDGDCNGMGKGLPTTAEDLVRITPLPGILVLADLYDGIVSEKKRVCGLHGDTSCVADKEILAAEGFAEAATNWRDIILVLACTRASVVRFR